MQDTQNEKAGRVLVSFWVPDYVYDNFIKRLGLEGVKDKKIKTGAVNSVVKVFAQHFACGKASLDIAFDPKPEELKKVA